MDLFTENPGLQITVVLILIPILFALILILIKVNGMISNIQNRRELRRIREKIQNLSAEEIQSLEKRKTELEFKLSGNELAKNTEVSDERGLINESEEVKDIRFLQTKRQEKSIIKIPEAEKKLIIWYITCAIFWLILGTSVGMYLGIKFVAPDTDHLSWLSFGRLRPVHTNIVFWGWSSIAMVGFSYFVVPRVGNTNVFNVQLGYYTLILMNTAVVLGTILLMAGINNSGGEYREYVWPVMLLFAVGIVITLYNHFKTVAARKTEEIYLSNWYIISALMFVITILLWLTFHFGKTDWAKRLCKDIGCIKALGCGLCF